MTQLTLDLFAEEFDASFEPVKTKDVIIDQVTVELIRRRRRQLLLHSYLYYQLNTSIISDHEYDAWARDLIRLQEEYPEEAARAEFAEDFKGFQMGDSFQLPYDEPWVHELAHRMIKIHEEKRRN